MKRCAVHPRKMAWSYIRRGRYKIWLCRECGGASIAQAANQRLLRMVRIVCLLIGAVRGLYQAHRKAKHGVSPTAGPSSSESVNDPEAKPAL